MKQKNSSFLANLNSADMVVEMYKRQNISNQGIYPAFYNIYLYDRLIVNTMDLSKAKKNFALISKGV